MAESNMFESSNNGSNQTELIIPPSLKFVLANIKSIVSITLAADTYPLWSTQILKLFKANEYEGYLNGTTPCPPKLLYTETSNPTPNPLYRQWQFIDQNLSAALLATVSTSIIPYVLNLDSTTEIWGTLKKRVQATNRSRVIQLKNELHRVSLKNNTMTHYLSEVKAIVDQIAAAGSQVDTEDILLYILNGLPPTYQAFKMAIRTRAGSLPLDDLYSLPSVRRSTSLPNSAKSTPRHYILSVHVDATMAAEVVATIATTEQAAPPILPNSPPHRTSHPSTAKSAASLAI